MSDSSIYSENDDYRSPAGIAKYLREQYILLLKNPHVSVLADERRIITSLVTRWPGDEMVTQIIRDTIRLLKSKHVNINTIGVNDG
jgi:hypothetical protein